MKTKRHRKCKACGCLYQPDQRTQKRQKYCSKSSCQRASKIASHRRWLSKKCNRNYFRGSENVERVRAWRRAHPGYWRRKKSRPDALQDESPSQLAAGQVDNSGLAPFALQDMTTAQPTFLVGLISHLTGSALQDEIEHVVRKLHTRGQEILGMGPGIKPQGGVNDARKASVVLAAVKDGAKAVQLDRSKAGAR